MKKLISVVLCLVLALVAPVCALSQAAKPLRVALILTGLANDQGWNQCAYDGLKLLESAYGCEIAYTENCTTTDMTAALTDYAAAGYDLIFGHSNEFGDPMLEVGELYPDAYFVAIEGGDGNGANVGSYQLNASQTAYITGMTAALMSKNNNVGMVAPIPSASLVKIVNGFEDGAKAANPEINVQITYTNSYIDAGAGRECAIAMIENGADVISHCANDSGLGALNAAIEKGVYCTGDSFDQSFLSPELMLTSAVYNVDKLMQKAYEDVVEGSFSGGVVEGGMADGIVRMADFNALIPEAVLEQLNATIARIVSGELVITADTTPRR